MLMKRILLSFFFCILSLMAWSQHNMPFPSIECEKLNGKHLSLPKMTNGKYTILGIAYSKRSEEHLKTWFKPIFYEYIHHAHHPVLFHHEYHVNVFFIPMFTGTHEISLHSARHYFKKHIDHKLHKHILVYRGSLRKYQEILDFEHVDKPYILVLDQDGRIVHEMTGEYSAYKMEILQQYIIEE